MSFNPFGSQIGFQVTCKSSLSEDSECLFLFWFIIKVSTARASPAVILVDFLSMPLNVAVSVLEACPVEGSVADLTDVHVIEGGTSVSG